MKREQVKSALVAAFFEAFFVVLAVLLAIAADNWREDRNEDREAQRALEAILDEIESNRDHAASARQYHMERMGAASVAMQNGAALTVADFPRGFIASAPVSSTAWEVAKVTGAISNLDYETILLLSRVYEAQESYEIQKQASGELIYRTIWESGTQAIPQNLQNLMEVLGTFVYRESELVGVYEEAIGALDSGE